MLAELSKLLANGTARAGVLEAEFLLSPFFFPSYFSLRGAVSLVGTQCNDGDAPGHHRARQRRRDHQGRLRRGRPARVVRTRPGSLISSTKKKETKLREAHIFFLSSHLSLPTPSPTNHHNQTNSVVPNCIAKPKGEKRSYTCDEIHGIKDISSLNLRRPVDRGYVVNWDLQKEIWDHIFKKVLKIKPKECHLVGGGLYKLNPVDP
jgi:hypothetical protein